MPAFHWGFNRSGAAWLLIALMIGVAAPVILPLSPAAHALPTAAAEQKPLQLEIRSQRRGTEAQLKIYLAQLRPLQAEQAALKRSGDVAKLQANQAALDRLYPQVALLFEPANLNNSHIIDAFPEFSGSTEWAIGIRFNPEGSQRFAELTRQIAGTGRSVGIFIDGKLISAPIVDLVYAKTGITGGSAVIQGNFTAEEAKQLATQFRTQSVPTAEPDRSLRLGNDRAQVGEFQAAIDHYTQAIQLQPQDVRAYVARATVQAKLENWQAAIADLTQAIARDPNNPNLYLQRGKLHEELTQDQQAVADYERVLQLDTPQFGIVVFQPLFKQYLQQENPSQAIALVDRVLNQLFSNADPPPELRQLVLSTRHLLVGMIQTFSEDHSEAVRSFTQAIKFAPQNTWAYYLRGVAFDRLGNPQRAQQDYRQVLKIAPEQALPKEIYQQFQPEAPVPAAHLASFYYVRGVAHFRLNDPQSAIVDLNQSIKLNPNYALAYRDRGLVLQQLGKQAAGTEDLRTAAQLFKQQRNAIGYGFVLEILLEDFPTTER